MNNLKLAMDKYFNGLNLALIRNQIEGYSNLVQVVDESTLSDLVVGILGELNVKYEDERIGVAMGFLNDYINGEIGERTLFHCLIGACNNHTKDLSKEVLSVSHKVLTTIYATVDDGDGEECDCANCTNGLCANSSKSEGAVYDLATIIKGILKGESAIMDGDVQVPCEVMLTVADYMDSTGLSHKEFNEVMLKGEFEGEVIDSTYATVVKLKKLNLRGVNSDGSTESSSKISSDEIKDAMKKVDERMPGSREKMLKASEQLKELGIDTEAMVIELLVSRSSALGGSLSREDIELIVRDVMNSSN